MRRLPPRSCVPGRFDHVPYRKRHPLHLHLPSKTTLTKLETQNMTKNGTPWRNLKILNKLWKNKTTTKISPATIKTPTPTAASTPLFTPASAGGAHLHFLIGEFSAGLISTSELSYFLEICLQRRQVAFQLDSWWFSSWASRMNKGAFAWRWSLWKVGVGIVSGCQCCFLGLFAVCC